MGSDRRIHLDIRLPELSGLEVLRRIRHQPEVVFATAYDRYAVGNFADPEAAVSLLNRAISASSG